MYKILLRTIPSALATTFFFAPLFWVGHAGAEELDAASLSEALAKRYYASTQAKDTTSPNVYEPATAAQPPVTQPSPVVSPQPAVESASTVSSPVVSPTTQSQAPEPLPTPQNTQRWTGTYAGVEVGGGFGTSRKNFTYNGTSTGDFGLSGVIGGFTVGHNEQFGKIVAGLEGDFSANSATGNANQPNPVYNYATDNTWLVTLRPRLGYDFGRVMPYVTGGLAVGDLRTAVYNKTTGGVGVDFARTELGWAAGTGLEASLSPNWSVKAEYLYVQLDNASGPSNTGGPTNISFNEHIGRVGLNYKLDQPNTDVSQDFFSSSSNGSKRISLASLTGIELGGQVSSYRYQEHLVSDQTYMHESGPNYGVTATATQSFNSGFFLTGDSRFAYGQNHYVGNGTLGGLPDYLGEVRALLGKDFLSRMAHAGDSNFDVSPYIGVGYRYLYNDFRGTRSNGSLGYRRDSQYLYMPVGITPRFRISNDARISTTLEYDQLLQGWQTTDLLDRSPTLIDATAGQYGGYGLRGSMMYERASWSMGPFFDYWNINQSATNCEGANCITEPHNQTIEYGLQARYRF